MTLVEAAYRSAAIPGLTSSAVTRRRKLNFTRRWPSLTPAFAKHRCTAHIDLATAYLQDGKVDEGVEHAVNALDIVAVTRHADSLRRVENLYPMIKTSGIPAARDLRRKLMEIKAAP